MSAKYLTTVVSSVALALALGVGFANTRPAQAQGGAVLVRAVDLDAVIQKSTSAKAVLTDFQNFQKTKQAELQKEQATLEQAQRQLGPSATQDEMQAYGQRVQAISRKLQEAEMEAQKRFASTQQKVLQGLAPTFQAYARETGVGMLVDSKTGGVLYVDPTWDVTQAVLGRVK
jgi:Skp family chaperone for outer membrane proteins